MKHILTYENYKQGSLFPEYDAKNIQKRKERENEFRKVDDFYNKLMNKIRETYFPEINEYYYNVRHVVENFSNGVLSYTIFIRKLSKICDDTKENIHMMVSEFIENWGDFEYKE